MSEKKVIVKIKKNGTINIESQGFQGEGCNVLQDFENSLGIETHRETTQEYLYQNPDYARNELST